MAAALGAASQAVLGTAGKVVENVQEAMAHDPILAALDLIVRIGTIFTIAGVAAFAISKAAKRMEQGFLNDINSRLNLPASNAPTPAVPPPNPTAPPTPVTPYYATDLATIVGAQLGLSPTDAQANSAAVWNAAVASMDIQSRLLGVAAPSQTQVDANAVTVTLLALVTDFGFVGSAEANYAQAQTLYWAGQRDAIEKQIAGLPAGTSSLVSGILQQGFDTASTMYNKWLSIVALAQAQANGGAVVPDWVSAGKDTGDLLPQVNTLAGDFGLPAPFALTTPSTTPPATGGWNWGDAWNATWQVAKNNLAVAFTVGSPGVILNLATGGATPQGGIVNQADGAINQDLSKFASGVKTLIGDVEKAAATISLALLNFPIIIPDGVGYAATWAADVIGSDLWPYLLGFGLAMAIGGAALRWFYVKVWPRLETRVELGANARLARLFNRFDKWYKTRRKVQEVWTQKSTEGMIHSANANPVYVAPEQVLPEPPIPSPPVAATAEAPVLPAGEPEPPAPPPEGTKKPEEKPLPMGTPTAETEKLLGEGDVKEPTADELRAMEAERKATLPPEGETGVVAVPSEPATVVPVGVAPDTAEAKAVRITRHDPDRSYSREPSPSELMAMGRLRKHELPEYARSQTTEAKEARANRSEARAMDRSLNRERRSRGARRGALEGIEREEVAGMDAENARQYYSGGAAPG